MTTERQPSRPRVSPLELRLYVASLLAAVYTVTWRAIAPAPAAESVTTAATTEQPRLVWIDAVPPAERPAISLPPGWQRASDPRAAIAEPARIVREPSRRVPRVRTRSS